LSGWLAAVPPTAVGVFGYSLRAEALNEAGWLAAHGEWAARLSALSGRRGLTPA
jgi:hypothetical protein